MENTRLSIDQCLKHGKLLFQLGDRLPPLDSCSPVTILVATSIAQVQILDVRVLAAGFVVEIFAFGCRTDPDIKWSHTARVADGLEELKEAIALSFQVRAAHFSCRSKCKSTERGPNQGVSIYPRTSKWTDDIPIQHPV